MDDDAIVQKLKQVPLFKEIESVHLKELAKYGIRENHKVSRHLVIQDKTPRGLFIILEGEVSLSRGLVSGERLSFAVRGPNECLGEISLLDRGVATATATANTDVTVYVIQRDAFDRFLSRSPTVCRALLKTVATRLREATDALALAYGLTVVQKVARRLLRLAADTDSVTIKSQQKLAEQVASTRESVNRAIGQLCDRGAITAKGQKTFLIHRAALCKAAGL